MDSIGPAAGIVIFVLLLMVEFVFSGFEAAIHNLSAKEIVKESLSSKKKKTDKLLKIMDNPFKYVNTVNVIISGIPLIVGGVYVNYLNTHYFKAMEKPYVALAIALVVMLYVLLTFGIYIPRRLGNRYSMQWAYKCITFTYVIMVIFTPITMIITLLGNVLLMLFGIKSKTDSFDVTEDEILSMVNEGHEQGVLLESEAKMITNIFEFCDKEAHDIMTNRQNISALPSDVKLKEAIHIMLEGNYSRYPVYEDNLDHIVGLIHLKDAMRRHNIGDAENELIIKIEDLIREVSFVPETKNIDALFKEMQSSKTQMVIVVDEYGQTSGLIAMEDILEEIVGNIEDEYDEEEDFIEQKGQDEYVIEGMTPLRDLEEMLQIEFNEEEFDTLNGFLISKMDKIPDENEDFDIDVGDYNFKILTVNERMIQEVLVKKIN